MLVQFPFAVLGHHGLSRGRLYPEGDVELSVKDNYSGFEIELDGVSKEIVAGQMFQERMVSLLLGQQYVSRGEERLRHGAISVVCVLLKRSHDVVHGFSFRGNAAPPWIHPEFAGAPCGHTLSRFDIFRHCNVAAQLRRNPNCTIEPVIGLWPHNNAPFASTSRVPIRFAPRFAATGHFQVRVTIAQPAWTDG